MKHIKMLRLLALLLTLALAFSLVPAVFADADLVIVEDSTENEEDDEDPVYIETDDDNTSNDDDSLVIVQEETRISITSSISVDVNETATISVNRGIANYWDCSNYNVVDITSSSSTSCRIRGLKSGSATITATDENGYSSTCSVRVYGSSSISLNKTSINPNVGETIRLTASTSPSNMHVYWRSSDTSIATVDSDGYVYAKKAGSCTITAYNDNYDVSRTCSVKVSAGIADTISYTTAAETPVKFNATDFINACNKRNGASLDYVKFTLPNSKDGVLCYDYVSAVSYSSVNASTQYTASSSSYCIDRVSFLPSKGFSGRVTISYKGTDKNGNTYDGDISINVSAPVVVTPTTPTTPTTTGTAKFTDVSDSDWFGTPVNWAVEKKIAEGKGKGLFAPTETCTHAHILTFLYRANGSPAVNGPSPFATAPASWYANAAIWAYEKGLVTDRDFNFSKDCTRADAVTYMWKVKGSPDMGNPSFTDVSTSAAYAKAVAWAVQRGVTEGKGGGLFAPSETCTRGHIVTFLYRDYTKA